MKPKF
jgi:hypothetical protein